MKTHFKEAVWFIILTSNSFSDNLFSRQPRSRENMTKPQPLMRKLFVLPETNDRELVTAPRESKGL